MGDLIAKNGDWPGGEEVSKRLKKMLPPELQEAEEGEAPPIPPQMQAQMEEMQGMIEGLTEQLNKSQDKLDNKMLELESKERIELLKLETDLKKTLLKEDAADSRQLLNAQMREIDMNQKSLNMRSATRQAEAQEPAGPPQQNQQPIGGPSPSEIT